VTPKLFWHTIEHIFKITSARVFKFGTQFLLQIPRGRDNIFRQKGRGLGHVTGKNLWQTFPNILKIIWATDFKFGQ